MNQVKQHAIQSLKLSMLASGFGVTLIASLILGGWVAFQLMVFLMQR